MNVISKQRQRLDGDGRNDQGFTLVEIVIAIVVVGILAVVVVVGISSLTDEGNESACTASADAARAGSTVYYASHGAYPATFTDLIASDDGPAALTLPEGVTASEDGLSVSPAGEDDWTLTMTPGEGGAAPVFACP